MRSTSEGVGWIEVVSGPMYSGKTEELIRRVRRARYARQQVLLFKPAVDTRYARDEIVTHSNERVPAACVAEAAEIVDRVGEKPLVVGLDEVQFFGADLPSVCEVLADRGHRVIAAGLDQDYRGRPFGPMPALMAVAEYVTKLAAVCVVCGSAASRSQRKAVVGAQAPLAGAEEASGGPSEGAGSVRVGGAELYEARCRRCHTLE